MMAATIIGCSGWAVWGQPVELLPLLPKWESIITLKAGGGYKDNVTLSHFTPEPSALLSAGAEALATRLYLDGSQISFFLSGDESHYLSDVSVEDEQLVFAQAQLKKTLAEGSEGGLGLEYIYQDQVVDASVTENIRQAVHAVGNHFTVRPGFRQELTPALWFALEVPVTRQFYQHPLEDYWEYGAKFTLGQELGNKSTLSLSCQPAYVAYDDAERLAANGRALTNTHRAFFQPDLRASWRQYWDTNRRWRTTARLGCRLNDDNGSGYFNFTQVYGFGEVRYRAKGWEIAVDGKLSYYHYPVQTVSDTDLAKRERQELYANLRVERKIYKALAVVLAYGYEQVFSNDPVENYRVNTVTGNLQWEF